MTKLTVDWSSHIIEPNIDSFFLEDEKTFCLFLLNKFEKTLLKEKLNLLVWSFHVGGTECPNDIDEKIKYLKTVEKIRFVFETNKAFSGDKFSTEEDLACIEIDIKLQKKGLLKLCFRSEENSDGKVAILNKFKYKKEQENFYAGEYELRGTTDQEEKIFAFIKELEEEYKKKRFIFIAVFFVFITIIVMAAIGVGLYFYFKSKKKVPK